jgi:hypothetical protein
LRHFFKSASEVLRHFFKSAVLLHFFQKCARLGRVNHR